MQKFVTDFTDRLLPGPSVQFRGAAVPERDDIVPVAHEYPVMGDFEKFGLLPEHLLSPPTADRNRGQVRDLFDDLPVLQTWAAGFAIVHGESSHHLTLGGQNRRGPARAQPVLDGNAVLGPKWVSGNVRDDDRLG